MYALARNDKTAGGVEPRPYAAFVVTGVFAGRGDVGIAPYKMIPHQPKQWQKKRRSYERLFFYGMRF